MATSPKKGSSTLWAQVAEYERRSEKKKKAAAKALRAAVEAEAPAPVEAGVFNRAEIITELRHAQATVDKYFYNWPVVESFLSAFSTLLLRNVIPSLALFVTGRSGAGKSTVVDMFSTTPVTGNTDRDELIRRLAGGAEAQESWLLFRDRFTGSSLLSMHSDPRTKKKEIEDRALFRLAKHKTIITGELSRIFRGGNDTDRTTLFAIIQQWLDGRGIQIDSGTHGALGEKGDFSFVWLGATTPFHAETWKVMSALGPRLLFFWTRSISREAQKVKGGDAYGAALEECRQAVQRVVRVLQKAPRRSEPWPKASKEQEDRIYRYAQLACFSQTFPKIEPPDPNHLFVRLSMLAAGRALLHGRTTLDESDMRIAKHVAKSSGPGRRGSIIFALAGANGPLTAYALSQKLKLPRVWVLNLLQELKASAVASCTPDGVSWSLGGADLFDEDDPFMDEDEPL